jgi:hypothetical protein
MPFDLNDDPLRKSRACWASANLSVVGDARINVQHIVNPHSRSPKYKCFDGSDAAPRVLSVSASMRLERDKVGATHGGIWRAPSSRAKSEGVHYER